MSFLNQDAPPGYISGLGRGATGFSTQADFGSTSRVKSEDHGQFEDAENDDEADKHVIADDKDDDEADSLFELIDKKLKRKKRKVKKHRTIDEDGTNTKVQVTEIKSGEAIKEIGNEFADAKQELASVSTDEWLSLPESGDFTKKTKRRREQMQEQQRYYRNSDNITLGLRDSAGDSTYKLDISRISIARDQVLAGQLAQANDNKVGVNQLEYISELEKKDQDGVSHGVSKFVSNVGDYQRTRSMFAKLRRSEPYKAENWIASARLEVDAKKLNRARELISEGCEKCPKSEEVWLVSLEIHSDDYQACRVIVADSVRSNPRSLRLWLKAVSFETDELSKKRVLMRALEFLPKSVSLWLEIVKYENDRDMQVQMLRKATSLIPTSVELWLKLASIQLVPDAQQTLNEARAAVNAETAYILWLSSAKLEEKASGNEIKVTRIVEKCFQTVGNTLKREDWLHEAIESEEEYPLTARAVVFNSMNVGLELSDCRLQTWKEDALKASQNGHNEVARSIYMFVTSNHPDDTKTWLEYASFEKKLGNISALYVVYEMATKACPNCVQLHLMYAKDKWNIDNDIDRARDILKEALKLNRQSEDVWFAAAKLEWINGRLESAIKLYEECRKTVVEPTARAWYNQVTLERYMGSTENAITLVDQGLQHHEMEPKLYLQKGQINESLGKYEEAREVYDLGCKKCPESYLLWIHLARMYKDKLDRKIKARSTLEEAIASYPKEENLYIAWLRVEGEKSSAALMIISKGLQQIPDSPLLWSANILQAKPQHRKNMYATALSKTGDHVVVVLTVARDLMACGKLAQAKRFFDACIEKDPDYGDAYKYYHDFLQKYGEAKQVEELERKFVENEPHHGENWCSMMKSIENLGKSMKELAREFL
ncbi:hypothetical protein FOA43_004620 [Brettanomyces nanus]|uniref:PRP1 splicing factor N-terminal domain-containing protein n=1 Tax=Eeniella nana TaxID=13502 RepID=A0A875S8J9_EENNA|nr:uncharacterized protein FOA43_004620 [Brettanomyces nanus]QPG77213.1 hypothetical protein FOA43_004620 [Brettanomyces nanus]